MIKDPNEKSYFDIEQRDNIAKECANHKVLDFKREIEITSAMKVQGTWCAALGTVKIADGDATGWSDLYRSFLYRSWPLRAQVASGDRAKGCKGLLLRDGFAECLGHAIVIRNSFADWLGPRIVSNFEKKEGAFVNDPYRTHFEPFVVQLYVMGNQLPFDISRYKACNLSFYRHVIDKWCGTDDQVADAFLAACEYHCDSNGFGEYANVPYLNFPVEILAAISIRKELGLSMPEIPHPLMQTPFVRYPVQQSPADDPILEAAIKKIREAHPEIGHPW